MQRYAWMCGLPDWTLDCNRTAFRRVRARSHVAPSLDCPMEMEEGESKDERGKPEARMLGACGSGLYMPVCARVLGGKGV